MIKLLKGIEFQFENQNQKEESDGTRLVWERELSI